VARLFDSTLSQVVNVQGAQAQLDNVVPFTWTAWVYRTANSVTGRIIAKGDGSTFKNFQEDTSVLSNAMRLRVGRATTGADAWTVAGTLPLSEWRFVACSYDSTDGPRIYVATVSGAVSECSYRNTGAPYLGSPIIGAGTETDDSAGEFCIGSRNNAGQSPLAARVSDVRVFSKVLSIAELNAVKGGAITGPMRGWWPLWGSQAVEPDWSGNNNHGTVNGATKVDGPPVSAIWLRPTRKVEVLHSVGGPQTTTKQIAGKANIFKQTTATRFYLSNDPIEGYTTTHGAWDNNGGVLSRFTMRRGPYGTSNVLVKTATSTAADYDVQVLRLISDPIKAYTFGPSDTMEWVIGTYAQSGFNGVIHVHAFVLQGETETERGTLLQDSIGLEEWTSFAEGRTEGVKTLQTVAAQSGDRIGIEIGFRVNASNTNRLGRIYYGGAGSDEQGVIIELGASPVPLGTVVNDLTAGSPSVTTEPAWIELVTSAPLFVTATHTIDGQSRIHATTDRTQTGKAAIFRAATTQTQTGKAAIKATTTRTQTGKGHIVLETTPSSQDIQGVSRIKRTETRTITGISNIATATQSARTISGRSAIKVTVDRTQTGKASVARTVDQSIQGTSKIIGTTSQTIDGRARIAVLGTTVQDIAGKARIKRQADQDITGRAFILTPTVTQRFKVKVRGR
jgi:hypothetical protein